MRSSQKMIFIILYSFYFEHYPYHNILHQKVGSIFLQALENSNEQVIIFLLEKTKLVQTILETASDGAL